MRKAIKKIRKILTIIAVSLLTAMLLVVVTLSLPIVQRALASQLSRDLAKALGAKVSIGRVEYFPLTSFSISNIAVYDTLGNQAIALSRIKIDVSPFIYFEDVPTINELSFDSLSVSIYHLPDGSLNLRAISTTDNVDTTATSIPNFQLNKLLTQAGTLSYLTRDGRKFSFDNIKLVASNISNVEAQTCATINNLSFNDIRNAESVLLQLVANKESNRLAFNSVHATYAKSSFDIDSASITLNDDGIDLHHIYTSISSVDISPELIKLLGVHDMTDSNVKISGILSSNGNNMSIRNLFVAGGEATSIWLDANLSQKSNWLQSNVDVRLHKMQTTIADVARAMGNEVDFKTDNQVGKIMAVASLKGTFADAKVACDITSNVGAAKISADASAKSDSTLEIVGKLGIDAKELNSVTNKLLQKVVGTIEFEFEGHPSKPRKVHAHAQLPVVEACNYTYSNILLDGIIDNKIFQSIALIEDNNGFVYVMGQGELDKQYYTLDMRIDSLRTGVLNLTPTINDGVGGLLLHSTFSFADKQLTGEMELTNAYFIGRNVHTHSQKQNLKLDIKQDNGTLIFDGDLINGEVRGSFDTEKQVAVLENRFYRAAPIFAPKHIRRKNNVALSADLHWSDNFSRIAGFVVDDISSRGKGSLMAHADTSMVNMKFTVDTLSVSGIKLDEVNHTFAADNSADLLLSSKNAHIPAIGNIGSINMHNKLKDNHIATNLKWNGKSKCDININSYFEYRGDSLLAHIYTDSTAIAMEKYVWQVNKSTIDVADKYLKISDLMVSNGDRYLKINGIARPNSTTDTIHLQLNKIRIEDVLVTNEDSKFSVCGDMNLNIGLSDVYEKIGIDCKGGIDRFHVNGDYLEHLDIQTAWNPDSAKLNIDLGIISGGKCRARGLGYLDSDKRFFDLMFDIDSVSDGFLNFYLHHAIRDISGTASGWLRVHGPLDDLQLHSRLVVHPTVFTVKQTNVTYVFNQNDSIILSPNNMEFKHLRFADHNGNMGDFHGNIRHNMFSKLRMNIIFDFNHQQVLNTTESDNNSFYGNLTADGQFTIRGTTSNLALNINAITLPDCDFYMQPFRKSTLSENNYIQFRSSDTSDDAPANNNLEDLLGGMNTHLHVRITPEANIKAIVNERTNNLMTVRGSGSLDIDIDKNGDMSIFGDYIVNKGTYNFTFGNIVNKRFEIQDGSKISWDGVPMNAMIDLTATYKLKASLYDLEQDPNSSADLKRRVPVQCNMHLTNRLVDPTIKFSIEVPSSQNYSQYTIDQYINSEEEMNRQVFMLLAAGRFYSSQSANASPTSQSSNSSYIGTTVSELVSNQLSDWISQNKYNLGLGVNYRPGDDETNEEYALAVSTEVLNNKIVLSGNVGYGRDVTEASNEGSFIGDFDVEVKLNKNGNLRAKAYTHSNNDVIYETSPTTQGIGISYQEDFNTFGELIRRYWYIISGQRRRDRKAAEKESLTEE